MLVLSRQVGEAIVIDDQIVVTVERFTSDDLELSLANVRGVPLGQLTLGREESATLPRGVNVIMIQAWSDKVRLGFSGDDCGTSVSRKEIWDDHHRAQ